MKIGSLFSGAGGLDMAVEQVFGGEVIWQSEMDKAASTVLAHRFPGVPNLGDITQIDFRDVEKVDILCGGFPCQDVSAAGKRAGIKAGTRSGLWALFANAIDVVRPRLVVIENVRGLLSARAHRNLEPANPTVGDGSDGPVLRAAGAVLGDLADLRYDAQWVTYAASDVGAPHRRERVFIVATDTERRGGTRVEDAAGDSQTDSQRRQAILARGLGHPSGKRPDGIELLQTPQGRDGKEVGTNPDRYDEWCAELKAKGYNGNGHGRSLSVEAQRIGRGDLLPTLSTHDSTGARSPESIARMDKPFANLNDTVVNDLLPTPNASDGSGGVQATAWGKYAPAIAWWEELTRPAPAPTEPNKNGNPRLSAAFSEWMMGWPAGWVTDPDIGISRNDQLRIIGNGVCPQQATAALTWLLQIAEVAA